MSEKNLVNRIINYLRSLKVATGYECFCFKEHGGMYGTAGIPDIICCYKGKFIAFEVKTGKNKPTKLQEQKIDEIQAAHGVAEVVYSLKEVVDVIEQYR